MKHHNVKDRLIERTVSVIASEGLDRTTTKAIVKNTDIPEAYIYQYFNGKDALLANAFETIDRELTEKILSCISIMYNDEWNYDVFLGELSPETKFELFFSSVWSFFVRNKEKCLAFVRYYYSPYFEKHSVYGHKENCSSVVEAISDLFCEDTDVWMLLSHIMNVIMDFAVKVFSDELPDSEETKARVFRLVYYSVRPFLKNTQLQDN